jgi:hypothetical protein
MGDGHSNDIFTEAGFNKFQLFYVETIMNDSSFPMLNRVKPIFEKMTLDEFHILVDKISKTDDYELYQQFFYFMILYRDMKNIQDFMNSEYFHIGMLEKFIIFTFGYFSKHDNTTEGIFDEILFFLNREKLFELTMNSKYIQNDKHLLFLMLSKFDLNMLNKYFASITDKSGIINYFLKLPDIVLKRIISRNFRLFEYILLMMAEGESADKISSEFFEKYREDIAVFSKLNDMIRDYKKTVDFEKEKTIPFNQRDMSRIMNLVNMAKELPDPVKAVEYFAMEQVFVDDMEKKIVLSALTDPIMKNIFSKMS